MIPFPPPARGRAGPRPQTLTRRQTGRPPRLRLEPLEDRSTPATFTVTNADDAGPGSLRQAVIDANAAATDDTIDFDPGVFNTAQTISLLTALPGFGATAGALTITGPGVDLLTVRRSPSATPFFRIFTSAAPTLTLTDLTVSGGFATQTTGPWIGGGGLIASGTVTLEDMAFTGNQTSWEGGAVAIEGAGFLTVRNSILSGNRSFGPGGGIRLRDGGLVVENSTIAGNTAYPGFGGGGIYFAGTVSTSPPAGFTPGTLVVRNSTIADNRTHRGGGIRAFGLIGTLLVEGSVVTGNQATDYGGGIATVRGTLVVRDSVVSGNTAAAYGGGIGALSSAQITVVNSTIARNFAGGGPANAFGGGIGVTADGAPGTATVTVRNSTVVGNEASGGPGSGGGGIALPATFPASLTIANSVVAGNTSPGGPDVFTQDAATTTTVNYSAIGSAAGFTPAAGSGNNLPFGTDLKLLPLALVGGPTRAIAPAFGSPLIDAGSNSLVPAGVTTDQRGGAFARVAGAAVDIGAVESQAPFLPVAAASAPTVTTAGGTAYQFTVTFSDPQGAGGAIDTAGVINNNAAVRVSGPNGFDVAATYVSIDDPADGTPRTATYSITPPGGSWNQADHGTYTVRVQASQVADTDGNFVAADAVGTFDVRTPYVVTTPADAGAGSLREAITLANGTPAPDRIEFDPAVFGSPQAIDLLTALPLFAAAGGDLTIAGPGQANLTVRRAAGAPNFRIIDTAAPRLTVSDLTISGGRATSGIGGGVRSQGTQVLLDHVTLTDNQAPAGGAVGSGGQSLWLRHTTVTGNTSTGRGGGITAGGALVIEYSEIAGNTAATSGGGLYFSGATNPGHLPGFPAGAILVRNSTLSGNTAGTEGGGIVISFLDGTVQVLNSTLSGNTAATVGGGLSLQSVANQGTVLVQDSTIVQNTANGAGGGGIAKLSTTLSTITIANSVVSGNVNATAPDIRTGAFGTTVNVNHSAVGSVAGFTPSASSGNNLPYGVDPLLGPLAANGGPTKTHLPQAGSPLFDAGSNALIPTGVPTDQRGAPFARIVDGVVDIGAVEVPNPKARVSPAPGQPNPTAGSPVRFAVRFSHPVTGFEAADVDLSASTVGGSLSAAVTGSGADYEVTVTGMSGEGDVKLFVPGGAAVDAAGLPSLASVGSDDTVRFDTVAPAVTIDQAAGQPDPTNGPVAFAVRFNEPVTGFTAADVDLTGSIVGGTLAAEVTGSGADYTVTVTGMTGTGTVVATIPSGAVTDLAGNVGLASTSTDNSVEFDGVGPAVTIDRAAGQADPTNTGPITFAVHFAEPVTGFEPADVDLSGSTVGGTLTADVAGSGADYTVTVTGMTGAGDVVATIPTGAAVDALGNTTLASTSTDNTVRFDENAPGVTIDRAAGQADPTNGAAVTFAVHFNKPVTGFTAGDVDLTGSTVGGTLTADVTGSGADYTVTVTGMTGEGDVVATIPTGAATDAAGNPSVASTSTDNTVRFDAVVPTVTIDQAAGQADPTSGGPIVFAVHFSEPVTGFTGQDVSFAGSTVGGTLAAAVTGSGADYVVSVTGMNGYGSVVASIPAGAAADPAGNGNTASASSDNGVFYDNVGRLEFSAATFVATAEGGVVTVTVARTGAFEGAVSVDLQYADGTAHSGGPADAGQADYTPTAQTFSWADGEGGTKSFDVPVPDDPLNEGTEAFALALVNPVGTPHLGLAAAAAVIGPSDPVGPGTYFDQDEDRYVVRLTGRAGSLDLYRADPDGDGRGPIERIDLSGTEPDPLRPRAGLSIAVTRARGNTGPDAGVVGLGAVTGSGLKALTARRARLTGPGIDLNGYLGSVILGDVADGAAIRALGSEAQKSTVALGVIGDGTAIEFGSAIRTLTANGIGTGVVAAPAIGTMVVRGDLAADVVVSGAGVAPGRKALGTLRVVGSVLPGADVTSPSIGTLRVGGDLGGDVTVSGAGVPADRLALGTLRVVGAVTGATIDVMGNVGAVIVGSFAGSRLYAGYNATLGTFPVAATVGTFRVTDRADGFRNSHVYATTFRSVVLASVTPDNGGTPFGFVADGAVRALAVRNPLFRYDPTDPATTQGVGDFQVRVV